MVNFFPKSVCCACSEFCGNELTECQFERDVYRLNHNILYLCFTQNVDPELLNAKHTVHNLLVMLDSPQLGRLVQSSSVLSSLVLPFVISPLTLINVLYIYLLVVLLLTHLSLTSSHLSLTSSVVSP